MSEITVENKLQLVQQIKSQYQRNRYDLKRREQILYGRSSEHSYDSEAYDSSMDMDDPEKNMPDAEKTAILSSRIRLVVAILLFAVVITCDHRNQTIFGYHTDTIFTAISQDMGSKLEHWIAVNANTIDSPVR
ncbi:MAG: hypothetical protein IJ833_04025 [Lachnospiraceae bacterium]|nr:hypothetical protein [Lachnospiraceae bacterium]